MRLLIIFFLLSSLASAEFITNLQATKTPAPAGSDITLTWDLSQAGANIGIFRGPKYVDLLPGDATTWTTTETEYGGLSYTVIWVWSWKAHQLYYEWKTVDVDVGVLVWDHPPVIYDYYFVYVTKIQGEYPPDPSLMIPVSENSTPLTALKADIVSGEEYFVGVASAVEYEIEPGVFGYNISPKADLDPSGNPVKFIWLDHLWIPPSPNPPPSLDIDH